MQLPNQRSFFLQKRIMHFNNSILFTSRIQCLETIAIFWESFLFPLSENILDFIQFTFMTCVACGLILLFSSLCERLSLTLSLFLFNFWYFVSEYTTGKTELMKWQTDKTNGMYVLVLMFVYLIPLIKFDYDEV